MPIRYKIPLLIIFTLILSVGLKGLLPPPVKNTEMRHEFWMKKTHPQQKFDVVIGGDSRTYRGFSTAALENEISKECEAMNFGYSSGGFSQEYIDFLVENTRQHGSIVLGITPHSLTAEAVKNEAFHQYYDAGWFEKFKGRYLSQYTKYTAPYKVDEVVDYFTGNEPEDQYFETYYPAEGWVKSSRIPEDTLVAIEIYEKLFQKYKVDTSVENQLLKQVGQLTQKGYTIYAFRVPTLKHMIALEDELSGFDEETFSKRFEKSGGHWIPINPDAYHSYDGSHLHFESANRLSIEVGKFMQKRVD